MRESGHISQEDLALYATQGLAAAEGAEIHSHLATCAPCASELSEIRGDLALLGLGVEQHALPQGARQRFLDKIAAEPLQAQRSMQAQRSTPLAETSVPAVVTSISDARSRRGAGFWTPWLVAAAMAIVAIALSVQNRALNEEIHDEAMIVTHLAGKASRAQQVLEVLTSPSAQRVTLTPNQAAEQPLGHATYLPDRGGLIFQASNLKPLPEDKTYELWVIPVNGKAAVPAGLFRPDALGTATLILPELPSGIPAKAFGVTIEKASGSNAPTSPILLSGAASGS